MITDHRCMLWADFFFFFFQETLRHFAAHGTERTHLRKASDSTRVAMDVFGKSSKTSVENALDLYHRSHHNNNSNIPKWHIMNFEGYSDIRTPLYMIDVISNIWKEFHDDGDDDYDDDNNNKYNESRIFKTQMESKCRLCQQLDRTINHVLSVSSILVQEI